MKLSLNADFTKFPRAVAVVSASQAGEVVPFDIVVLAHDERHLRRRVIELVHGDKVLVDLAEPVALSGRERLLLEDGRQIEVIASEEEVYDIRARDAVDLAQLAWHIGNRHLAAQIEADRILILRDHVIKTMLEGLGATVAEVSEPFEPLRGAYSGGHHGHGHDHDDHGGHDHNHDHGHDHGSHHDHGERDAFGRLPGDPHYGHHHG